MTFAISRSAPAPGLRGGRVALAALLLGGAAIALVALWREAGPPARQEAPDHATVLTGSRGREHAAATLRDALARHDDRDVEQELTRRLAAGFPAALASLDGMPGADRARTGDLYCRLVRLFVRADPMHARQGLLAAYGDPLPAAIVDTSYAELATRESPEQLAAALAALPPGDERSGAARALVARWGREAPEIALRWARAHREALDDAGMAALAGAVATNAPRDGLQFVLEQRGTFERSMHWEMLVSDIVPKAANAENALDWLVWAAEQPLGATAWNDLARHLFAQVCDSDPATALGFASELNDPHLRDELLAAAARGAWVAAYGAQHGPAALAALFEDPAHQALAIRNCAEQLAARDPHAAAVFLAEVPAGRLKNELLPRPGP